MEEKFLQEEEPGAERNSPFLTKSDLSSKFGSKSFSDFDVAFLKGKFTLTGEEKLKSKKIIEQLFRQGKSVSSNGFTLVYLVAALPAFYPAQAGFSVPKKFFKHAVDRNKIKRMMREVYRRNRITLYDKLLADKAQMAVMFVYKGKLLPVYNDVDKGIKTCLDKVLKS